ncbi:hypothetical protein [Pontibacter sp. H249]|uniref:hypothetical protein n=1 Tax=Pontibacter sp. H249 TaxID=3133420 RepID=UPI0030BECE59
MNSIVNPLAKSNYSKPCLTLSSHAKRTSKQEEDTFDFSTIDGGMVTYNEGAKAISNGAGIFIGDYFVGVSDSYQSITNLPYVRY